jgi:Na+-transporting methylmalonyl-CoA/oxaloacetate decarboxylase beta subunit
MKAMPASPEDLFAYLDSLGITHSTVWHEAMFTVAQSGALRGDMPGAHTKNLFLKDKLNPMIGAAGVSAVPDSARVVHILGQEEDPQNFLLMHAMAPNVAGVIGSAIAAGVLWAVML